MTPPKVAACLAGAWALLPQTETAAIAIATARRRTDAVDAMPAAGILFRQPGARKRCEAPAGLGRGSDRDHHVAPALPAQPTALGAEHRGPLVQRGQLHTLFGDPVGLPLGQDDPRPGVRVHEGL